jgi:hypothetical protein
MDLALSSSMVLGAAVLVWLLWVAPYATRRRRAVLPSGEAILLTEAAVPPESLMVSAPLSQTPPRGAATEDVGSAPSSSGGERPPGAAEPQVRLRIRWGRVVLALAGLAAALAVPVTLVLLVVGLPAWVPALCAAGVAAAVASLRALAVRDRKRRVDEAFKAAMRSASAQSPSPAAPQGPTEVFDAGRDPEPAPRPVSHSELRALALEVAKASQANATAEAKATGAEEEWEPVDVPRPGYVAAPRAERPEPAPLDVPEAPKPEGRPLLKPQPEVPEPGSVPGVPSIGPRPGARRGALGNLDEVLNRRRA